MLSFIGCIMVFGPVIWWRVFAVIFLRFSQKFAVFFPHFAVIFYCPSLVTQGLPDLLQSSKRKRLDHTEVESLMEWLFFRSLTRRRTRRRNRLYVWYVCSKHEPQSLPYADLQQMSAQMYSFGIGVTSQGAEGTAPPLPSLCRAKPLFFGLCSIFWIGHIMDVCCLWLYS